jgi:hypothetical protein
LFLFLFFRVKVREEDIMTSVCDPSSRNLQGGLGGHGSTSISLKASRETTVAGKKPPKLQIPKRELVGGLEQFDKLEEELTSAETQDVTLAHDVAEWMAKKSLPWLQKLQGACDRLRTAERIQQLLKSNSGEVDENEKPMTNGEMKEWCEKQNANFLNAAFYVGDEQNPIVIPALRIRQAAHMALLNFRILQVSDLEGLLTFEDRCTKDEYFVKDDKGLIRIQKRRYRLSTDEKFGGLAEEESAVADIVGNVMRAISSKLIKDQQEMVEVMKSESEIGLKALLANSLGKCFVHVPYASINGSGRDKLPEVYLLVHGDGEGRVFIDSAIGPDEETAMEISDAKIHLNLTHLLVNFPPKEETMVTKWHFSQDEAHYYIRFWGYIFRARRVLQDQERRAIDEEERKQREILLMAQAEKLAKAKEEASALKECFLVQETISLREILAELKPGIFFAEYVGDWKNQAEHVFLPSGILFFLGQIEADETGALCLKVHSCSEYLQENLFKEASFNATPCGERFENLGYPLRDLMRALFRQEEKRKALTQ